MGARTGKRGNAPESYGDEDLAREIARMRTRLRTLEPAGAALRKQYESRLYNLEREQARRA